MRESERKIEEIVLYHSCKYVRIYPSRKTVRMIIASFGSSQVVVAVLTRLEQNQID